MSSTTKIRRFHELPFLSRKSRVKVSELIVVLQRELDLAKVNGFDTLYLEIDDGDYHVTFCDLVGERGEEQKGKPA